VFDIIPDVVRFCWYNMVLEGKGSIYEHVKGRIVVYIPTAVHKDSQFPFEVGEKVNIKIEDGRLIVEKE